MRESKELTNELNLLATIVERKRTELEPRQTHSAGIEAERDSRMIILAKLPRPWHQSPRPQAHEHVVPALLPRHKREWPALFEIDEILVACAELDMQTVGREARRIDRLDAGCEEQTPGGHATTAHSGMLSSARSPSCSSTQTSPSSSNLMPSSLPAGKPIPR